MRTKFIFLYHDEEVKDGRETATPVLGDLKYTSYKIARTCFILRKKYYLVSVYYKGEETASLWATRIVRKPKKGVQMYLE